MTVLVPQRRKCANRIRFQSEGGPPAQLESSRDHPPLAEIPLGISRGSCCPPAPLIAMCRGKPRNRRPSTCRVLARSSEHQPRRNGSADREDRKQPRLLPLVRSCLQLLRWVSSFLQLLCESPQLLPPPVSLVGLIQFHAKVTPAIWGDRCSSVNHHLGGHANWIGSRVEQVF
jgi:hypothetical protein